MLARTEDYRKTQRLIEGAEFFQRPQVMKAARELFAAKDENGPISLSSSLANNADKLIQDNLPIIVTNLEIDQTIFFSNEPVKLVNSIQELEQEIAEWGVLNRVFIPIFEIDEEALPFLRILYTNHGLVVPPLFGPKNSYRFTNRKSLSALELTWSQIDRISHWDLITHENLTEALEITSRIPGDVIEIGVYKGGTALTILNYLQFSARVEDINSMNKKCFFLDTFDGFDEPAHKNPDQIWRGTHKLFGTDSTLSYVRQTLETAEFNFSLLERDIITDELPTEIYQISFAHIDVDSYLATSAALRKVGPKISRGGIILLEDPPGTPSLYGAYFAMREFLDSPIGFSFTSIFKQSHYMLLRTND